MGTLAFLWIHRVAVVVTTESLAIVGLIMALRWALRRSPPSRLPPPTAAAVQAALAVAKSDQLVAAQRAQAGKDRTLAAQAALPDPIIIPKVEDMTPYQIAEELAKRAG